MILQSAEDIKHELSRFCNPIVGLTCGCFDIIHAGHVDFIEMAKDECDILLVLVNTDESVKELKGNNRPIIPFEQRIKIVNAIKGVDYTAPLPDKSPARLIKFIKPNVYIKGGDYTEAQLKSAPIVRAYDGKIVIIPFITDISTTQIINKIRELYSNDFIGEQYYE